MFDICNIPCDDDYSQKRIYDTILHGFQNYIYM